MTDDEKEMLGDLNLLTLKPIIYVANVSEDEAAEVSPDNEMYNSVKKLPKLKAPK